MFFNKLKIYLLLIIFCAASSSLACYAVEPKQDAITKKYDFTLEEEQEIGFRAALVLIKKYGYYKNPLVNQYINSVGENIAGKVSKRPDIKYRFIVLNTSEVNAFAEPGGFIMVTKGTLSVIDNEAELAGLLGHEIAHIEEGHGLQSLTLDPNMKDKLRMIRIYLDSGEGLSQRNMNLFDEDLKKNRGTSNTVNFDSAINSDNFKKGKIF